MYLLDTNVVSELRRPRPHGAVLTWLKTVDDGDIHIAAVTIGELQTGVERCRDHDPAKALEIETWLNSLLATRSIIPMNASAFRQHARLMHRRSNTLHRDAMIAATAIVRGFTVATRNTSDFALFGVPLLNPFETPA